MTTDNQLSPEEQSAPEHPKLSRRDELVEQYQRLHETNPNYGKSSELLCGFVQPTLEDLPTIRTILDYGCGKSRLVDWLAKINDAEAYRYDPAIPEFSKLPVEKVDVLINTDVLEHIDEADLDDLLAEIARLSPHVYFNIATAPAQAILPNGENAHVTVRPSEWWGELLGRHFETVRSVQAWRGDRCSFVTWRHRHRAAASRRSRPSARADCLPLSTAGRLDPDMASAGALDALFGPHAEPDTQAMARTQVQYGGTKPPRGYKADVGEHLRTMAFGSKGGPLLFFYHNGLIVHIRRNINTGMNWQRFDRLWRDHTDVLLEGLNSRWLTAACDTIIDCSEDPAERSAAMAGSILTALIKLHETERRSSGQTGTNNEPGKRLGLNDRPYGSDIGKGDVVKKLIRRIDRPAPPDAIALRILQVLLKRARDNDTVLKRFATVHQHEPTR